MLIENALADAVQFFHIDALSSSVGLKVDFGMALLVPASCLYRVMARRMRGYSDAKGPPNLPRPHRHAGPGQCHGSRSQVKFHRRAHWPIVLVSGLFNKPLNVPWGNDRTSA
jgi:hypothetical protein